MVQAGVAIRPQYVDVNVDVMTKEKEDQDQSPAKSHFFHTQKQRIYCSSGLVPFK
jgi:hypothetical protein